LMTWSARFSLGVRPEGLVAVTVAVMVEGANLVICIDVVCK
jgi:hypothetical protein